MRRRTANWRPASVTLRRSATTPRRFWILLAWIFGILLLSSTADCFVARVMRSFLFHKLKRSSHWVDTTYITSRFYIRSTACFTSPFVLVRAASNQYSVQSYADRHSRQFSSSEVIPSSNSFNIDLMKTNEESSSKADGARKYTDYEKWVRRLYMTNMFHPVKLGLTNMQKLHDIMGNPMDNVSCHAQLVDINARNCLRTSPYACIPPSMQNDYTP